MTLSGLKNQLILLRIACSSHSSVDIELHTHLLTGIFFFIDSKMVMIIFVNHRFKICWPPVNISSGSFRIEAHLSASDQLNDFEYMANNRHGISMWCRSLSLILKMATGNWREAKSALENLFNFDESINFSWLTFFNESTGAFTAMHQHICMMQNLFWFALVPQAALTLTENAVL